MLFHKVIGRHITFITGLIERPTAAFRTGFLHHEPRPSAGVFFGRKGRST